MRVVFMGTPDFAVPTLEALCFNHDVIAVVTQPDRPSGRGKKLAPPPVKVAALSYNIPVYQFEKLNTDEAKAVFEKLAPDIIVVVAYGQLLKPWLLNLPTYGCLNVHASLLPKWRGAAPIHWGIVSGDTEGGITIQQMDVGLDTGDMLLKKQVPITPHMTYGDLHDVLKVEGALALIETLDLVEQGALRPEKQDDSQFTYAKMIDRDMAKVDWQSPGKAIVDLIRGFDPWPIAFTTLDGERIKLYQAYILENQLETKNDETPENQLAIMAPGTIVEILPTAIVVKTIDGRIAIKAVQAPNGKRMDVKAFMAGHPLPVGTVFGH